MVATVRNLTSASATSEYFQRDGGYYLAAGSDSADIRAKQTEHREWECLVRQIGLPALGLRVGQKVSAGTFETPSAGSRNRDWNPSRAPPRRNVRAQARLRHHLLGSEIRVAGGAAAYSKSPARGPWRAA